MIYAKAHIKRLLMLVLSLLDRPQNHTIVPALLSTVLTRARALAASLWTFVASEAIPSSEDGDAREAARLRHGRPQGAVGAVRVCAAPGPRLQALHVTVCAALTTAWCPAGTLTVPSKRRQIGGGDRSEKGTVAGTGKKRWREVKWRQVKGQQVRDVWRENSFRLGKENI